jgi:hypothetical protein
VKDWRNELDALVSETMAFVKAVTPDAAVSVVPLGDDQTVPTTPTQPLDTAAAPLQEAAVGSAEDEREQIRQRLADFKALQQRWIREREEFAQSMLSKARSDQRRDK